MIYRDTTAIKAVNDGRDTPDAFYDPKHPSVLIATSKWHATDGWRGYTEVAPQAGYKMLDSDWMTGDWGDDVSEVHGETATEKRLATLEKKHGDLFVIYTPTSNVFSTAIDVLVRDSETAPIKGRVIAHKTRLFETPTGNWRVQYHATDVVSYNAETGKYKLDTGGWATMTTSKRMTEALPNGWYVYRRNWIMYLHRPDFDDVEITDGMEV